MKKAKAKRQARPKPVDPRHQPSKAELEADVSLPVTPERLMRAVVAGGAKRRDS
ncbi:MAG: hypothetical protein OXC09_05800 [Truepera sp.]|nr:hypothetical protein [Truepera sp.]